MQAQYRETVLEMAGVMVAKDSIQDRKGCCLVGM
jgi:hypothetical protein